MRPGIIITVINRCHRTHNLVRVMFQVQILFSIQEAPRMQITSVEVLPIGIVINLFYFTAYQSPKFDPALKRYFEGIESFEFEQRVSKIQEFQPVL